MNKQIIFAAMYNPMIHESSFGLVSIHRTKKGAEMAIDFHKEQLRKIWNELHTEEEQKEYPFGQFESWQVYESELYE